MEELKVNEFNRSHEGICVDDKDLFRPTSKKIFKKKWVGNNSVYMGNIKTRFVGDANRAVVPAIVTHKLMWVDVITGSMYHPHTGECSSSTMRKLELKSLRPATNAEIEALYTVKSGDRSVSS